MDFRPVAYIVGILICTLAVFMFIPLLVDLAHGSSDWQAFFFSSVLSLFLGGTLVFSSSGNFSITPKQGFMMITLSWLALSLFGAIPFWVSSFHLSFTDAFFEAISGITTTGSTVITNLEEAPPGFLIWRAILQWLGGIGIILMAMTVLPFLKVGGMQIFQTELSENEKALPRLTKQATLIAFIYIGLTLICAELYHLVGMSGFDAFAHALTTISTGGYSTYDTSFGHYDDFREELVAIVFMTLSGLPFILYLKAVKGDYKALFKDSQVRWFLSIIGISIYALSIYLISFEGFSAGEALRRSSFNIVSLITGTGYANGDYGAWGGFTMSLLFFLMVVGGCAGSTSCGIKIFRFQVLTSVTGSQLKQLVYPHGIFLPHYNGKPLKPEISMSVMSFFFLYAFCFSLLAIALSSVGLDFLTAMSGAATAISNVGPGMGDIIGPTGTFAPLPDSAKWILCVGMILGRLELFTVLILLTPGFWRR